MTASSPGRTARPTPSAARQLLRIAPSLYLPTLVYEIGNGAIAPVVALTAIDVGASPALAAFTLTLNGVGRVLGDIPAGALANRIGERRAMLVAAAVNIVALAGCVVARSPLLLGVALLSIGLPNATFYLARQSYLIEVAPTELRATAMSTLGGSHRIGLFIGPFIGAAAIGIGGLRAPYVVAMLSCVAVGILLVTVADVPPPQSQDPIAVPAAIPAGALPILRRHRRMFATLGLGILACGAVSAARQTILPLWGAHIGLTAQATSLVFGVAGLMDTILFYPAGKVMDRYGRLAIAVPSMAVMGLAIIALPLTTGLASLTAVAVAISLGNGIGAGLVQTIGADTAPTDGKIAFLSIFRLVIDSGIAAGPLIVSVVATTTLAAGIISIGIVSLLGGAALARWMPRYSAFATPAMVRAHRQSTSDKSRSAAG